MDRYDSIIIGAGHNGLVCAARLARSGQRVLVLEATDGPGGLAAEREFHPGFKATVAHSLGHFPQSIADELGLAGHGFSPDTQPLPTVALSPDEEHVVIGEDSVSGVGAADDAAYRDFTARMSRFAEALAPFWQKTMPRIGDKRLPELLTFAHLGLNLRRLGKDDLHEFLRVASLPMRDLLDEYFDNDLLKAALSWDGLIGSKMAPRSPNGAVLALLYRRAGNRSGAPAIPKGGVGALVRALAAAATAAGAEIRYDARVTGLSMQGTAEGLAATGVTLADGRQVAGDRVVSAVDPKTTFLGLVGAANLDIGFTNRIRRLRSEGYVAKLHLALDGAPEFAGLDGPAGRLVTATDMDAIEFAYDDAKYGEASAEPVLEMIVPSLSDASFAPSGKHLLSAQVMYVPCNRKGGWDDAAREALMERTLDIIERYAPGIRSQVIAGELLTPADLEADYGVAGGHWHHGDLAMDQMLMMRPTYGAAQYRTPIGNLYLCGAGSHPGGDVTGLPGHNAASEILE